MARIFIVYFTVIAGIFVSAIANEYCKITCNYNAMVYKHTMCLYPSPSPGPACGKPQNQGFTDAEKNAVLRKHNELRKKVASGKETRGSPGPQPAAVNMPDLTWDDELATIAQRWVNQCTVDHDDCNTVKRFSVGQNIAYNPDATLEELIQDWYDEVEHFDPKELSSFQFSMNTGHYTQVVWADTTKIGCGKIRFTDSDGWNGLYLVCNYGPSGNYNGEPIYKVKT